jgi:hypothetical protein
MEHIDDRFLQPIVVVLLAARLLRRLPLGRPRTLTERVVVLTPAGEDSKVGTRR